MAPHPTITHVIFDLDGLLLNTEPLIFQVAQAIAHHYGKRLEKEIRLKTAGIRGQDSARVIIDHLKLPITVETYLDHKASLIETFYPRAQPMPGAHALTRYLEQHRIPRAVATSSSQHPFSLKTSTHADWFRQFSCIVTGDDPAIQNGKPAPDIFLIAAQRMGAVPEQCLVFEDSLAGVAAGKAAGMAVIAVPDPIFDPVLYHDADQILASLTDFSPTAWGLPPQEWEG
ncbi:MAG: HAD-IA family hydrolase [Leptolyngbyaceae bacterium]|nr:HAD-IA family hydrolase [Leptolyngbyaceae bacterium]